MRRITPAHTPFVLWVAGTLQTNRNEPASANRPFLPRAMAAARLGRCVLSGGARLALSTSQRAAAVEGTGRMLNNLRCSVALTAARGYSSTGEALPSEKGKRVCVDFALSLSQGPTAGLLSHTSG